MVSVGGWTWMEMETTDFEIQLLEHKASHTIKNVVVFMNIEVITYI